MSRCEALRLLACCFGHSDSHFLHSDSDDDRPIGQVVRRDAPVVARCVCGLCLWMQASVCCGTRE